MDFNLKRLTFLSLGSILLFGSCGEIKNKPDGMAEAKAKEWEELVKKHTDTSVKVFGHYAAVKLPIDKGVPLWNPTNVAIGPDGVMYAANYTGEIYSLQDTDGDGLEDEAKLFCDVKDDGLRYPTSMIFKENK